MRIYSYNGDLQITGDMLGYNAVRCLYTSVDSSKPTRSAQADHC